MKRIKLHQWPVLFLAFAAFAAACSQKSFTAATNSAAEKYELPDAGKNNNTYLPPPVLIISDEKAKTNKEGELYYDDGYGYRYWKYSDGKYYLDQRYENSSVQKKKTAVRKKNTKTGNTASSKDYTAN
jgi:hypothetical protein